jgi:site-specific DNA recombinase
MTKQYRKSELVIDETLLTFSKGTVKNINSEKNAVIYTRVSTKEQAENNNSLNTQFNSITTYAQNNKFNIIECFGGKHESAKTDGRKEFQRMLTFVKKKKNNISHILVYSTDRFSRTGGDAIKLAEDLRKIGVSIFAITQPTDTDNANGKFQQNLQFIFSNYDNELRKQKCTAGMIDALLQGKWTHTAPIGYERAIIDGEKVIIISEQGKILKKAFEMKARENITNEEIVERLKKFGLIVNRQNLSRIFRNVFYCGYISHSLIPGQIVKGIHPPLVSETLFKMVNNELINVPRGWKHACDYDDLPLKGILVCDTCGNVLTGYQASKRANWYYKCRVKGCKVNKSAEKLNESFFKIISNFTLNQKYKPLLKMLLSKELEEETKENVENIKLLETRLNKLNSNLDKLEHRYAIDGDVDIDLYLKLRKNIEKEISPIAEDLSKLKENSSNIGHSAEIAVDFLENLSNSWTFSDYSKKQKLQKMIFPDGIRYNKEKEWTRRDSNSRPNKELICFLQSLEHN